MNFSQIDETQDLFKNQSILFESECTNYRIRHVLGFAGTTAEECFQCLFKQEQEEKIFWDLISRDKKFKTAVDTCIKHSKKPRSAEEKAAKYVNRGSKLK